MYFYAVFSLSSIQVTSEDDPQVLCLKHAVEHIREKGSPEGFKILSRHDTVSISRGQIFL